MKQQIHNMILDAGAARVGFATTDSTGIIDPRCTRDFRRWLQQGCHGDMQWLENHAGIRMAPSRLLDGPDADPRPVSVIVAAFAYKQPICRKSALPHISRFAYGEDYHKVLRRRLKPVCRFIEQTGAKARICVDSAPLHERYWAMKAGVGRQGLSGLIIVPETGTYCLLAEIVTDLQLEPDEPLNAGCKGCRRCIDACPAGAIRGDGSIDASRCHSYLTIEHKGEIQPDEAANLPLFGCDRCQIVCPHNRDVDTSRCLPEFLPDEKMLNLTREELIQLTPEQFNRLYGHTPLRRRFSKP